MYLEVLKKMHRNYAKLCKFVTIFANIDISNSKRINAEFCNKVA